MRVCRYLKGKKNEEDKSDSGEEDEYLEEQKYSQDDHKDAKKEENLSQETLEGKMFGCSKCGKYFVNLEYLSQHKNSIHMKINQNFSVIKPNKKVKDSFLVKMKRHDFLAEDDNMGVNEADLSDDENHDQILDIEGSKIEIKTERTEENALIYKKNKLFPCSKCGESFKHLKLLAKHKNETHLAFIKDEFKHQQKEQRPSCSECDESFDSKHILKMHIIKCHTNAYPFVCDICGKGFTRKIRFHNHVQNCGLPIKPLQKICSVCDKSFEKSNNFSRHMASHSKTKDFQCVDCGKAYADKRNLITHVQLMHPESIKQFEKEKKNKCDRCDEHFVMKTEVALHKIKSHGESYHTFCETCGKGFLKKDYIQLMKNHKKKCF